jgi:hypothetical protein
VKNLLRLIGLLNINRNNFSSQSHNIKQFTAEIFGYVTKYLSNIISSVTVDEWPLFKNGFSLIVYTHLTLEKSSSSTISCINFLGNSPNRNQVEEIAIAILDRYYNLKQHIADIDWSELLTFITPDRILLEYLEFNRSFDSYLMHIGKFTIEWTPDKNFKENFIRHFDSLVDKCHFIGKLRSLKMVYLIFLIYF